MVADNAVAFARERDKLIECAGQPTQQVAARRLRILTAGAGELRFARGDVLLGGGQPALDALDHAGLIAQALDADGALLSGLTRGTRGAELLLQGADLLAELVCASARVLGQGRWVACQRRSRRRLPSFGLLVAVGLLAGDRHPLAACLTRKLAGVFLAGDEAGAQGRTDGLDFVGIAFHPSETLGNRLGRRLDAQQAVQQRAALGFG